MEQTLKRSVWQSLSMQGIRIFLFLLAACAVLLAWAFRFGIPALFQKGAESPVALAQGKSCALPSAAISQNPNQELFVSCGGFLQ